MRSLMLIIVLCGWIQALDLTVTSSFNTDEDTDLVFSYAEMLAKCTVSETPDHLQIVLLESSGTVYLGSSAAGPWTAAIETNSITPTQFVRFTPNTDVNGTKSMMSVRAWLGGASSSARPIDVIIAPLPDPITIATHPFVQPVSGSRVSEDTPFTFTFADLATTLQVQDVDGQPFKLVITGRLSGNLSTVGGAPITLPHEVNSGDSFRWQGDLNVFTKTGESDIEAFSVKAVNITAPFDQTATVTFATPIDSVVDSLAGVQTTMSGFGALVVTRGVTKPFTHAQFLALTVGSNSVDRNATYALRLSEAANGCTFTRYDSDGLWAGDFTTFPTMITIHEGETLQVTTPSSMSTGTTSIGTIAQADHTSAGYSPEITLNLRVLSSNGGTTGSSNSGGGGGGCGAGSAMASILLAITCLVLFRRQE